MRNLYRITLKKIEQTVHSFSLVEKSIFYILVVIFTVSILGAFVKINTMFIVKVPTTGGSLEEGVIGAPRFINPLLAISDADRDLTALVYSGLLRATPGGELIPDLAKEFFVSDDGLTYTFILKKDLKWHDGKPITSDDIVFTVNKVQDNTLKSIKRASWDGVSVLKINDTTIVFTLKQRYSPFLENTTLGILPRHIWKDISSEQFGFSRYNIEPIGSGPYKVVSIHNNPSGIPDYYNLVAFKHFSLGRPYINKLKIHFYSNEEAVLKAFNKQDIESVNAIAFHNVKTLEKKNSQIVTYVLPRVFGVFFNQNQNNLFTHITVRRALEKALDRESIIKQVLLGYGTPIDGPLPPGTLGFTPYVKEEDSLDVSEITKNDSEELKEDVKEEDIGNSLEIKENIPPNILEAREILEDGGWRINEETGVRERKTKKGTETLEFSISTSDTQELKDTAVIIKETWEQLGAIIELKIFNASDLNRSVIRPRKYDALFFGEIIGRESDPFAFWHSSQRNDPGLNISLYANITADELLEEGRVTFNKEEREEIYKRFEEEIQEDIPAVFVYSPDFIYIIPLKIHGVDVGTITVPSERFLDIYTWYIEVERLWKIFAKNLEPIK